MTDSPYERLGCELGLKEIVDDFIDRVTGDVMIGFFFRAIDKVVLKRLELEFATTHLGGPVKYSGRPLKNAHSAHKIMGGQFNRRLRILENTLKAHNVPQDIQNDWLAHNEQLRSHITRDTKYECSAQGLETSE